MPFRVIPPELQNLPSQVALQAFGELTDAQRDLVNTDLVAWHQVYDDQCRSVLRRLGRL
jgi:hypothetical protein